MCSEDEDMGGGFFRLRPLLHCKTVRSDVAGVCCCNCDRERRRVAQTSRMAHRKQVFLDFLNKAHAVNVMDIYEAL